MITFCLEFKGNSEFRHDHYAFVFQLRHDEDSRTYGQSHTKLIVERPAPSDVRFQFYGVFSMP